MSSADQASPSRWRRWLTIGVAIYFAGIAGVALVDWLFNRMTFFPSPGIDLDPASLGLPVEEVRIPSGASLSLHGFLLPADSRQAILFLHGNAGNASHRLPVAAHLAGLGYNVLLMDYRGYGLSEGRPTERGIYQDAEAGWQWLVDRGFDPDQIVLFGRSLGGAVAVELAARRSVGKLVLVATFTSAADMARAMGLGWAAWAVGDRLNAIGRIDQVTAPVLSLHGTRDQIVPPELGRRLHDAAPVGAGFHLVPQAGHNDLIGVGGPLFWRPIEAFLDDG